MSDLFSFKLPETFLAQYRGTSPEWGFTDAGGNSVGELTFVRTYSRKKADGTKERWDEVCERVINGMYSIQKDHAKSNRLPWHDRKAQASAQEAYDRLFNLKWTPPGRGLWMMGTEFVMKNRNAAALQNCGFVSTADIDKRNPGEVFYWVMDALMLGVGIGWDTLGSEKNIVINQPLDDKTEFVIEDSREGWAASTAALINSFLRPNSPRRVFDYSQIRPYGRPIGGFGGTASGPEPLIKMHRKIEEILEKRVGQTLNSETIADIMNLIGTCVVAGNVRRSAELALGQPDDYDFLNLKNPDVFPERNSYDPDNPGWGWMSNNSLSVEVGTDYSPFVDNIASNGEPGFVWLDTTRAYSRLADAPDNKDWRAMGYNPCAEQSLESFECCTLVETHLNRHESKEDFLRTLKFAYLYGKTVTLLPTHWDRTNAVMQRNRRIGTSTTGAAGFVETHSLPVLREWWDAGYERVQELDKDYSEWLGVRESIKSTSVKPSGSVSLLSGATPGVHWPPGGEYYLRAIRFSATDPFVIEAMAAGYTVEPDVVSKGTVVVYFPIHTDVKRSEKDVSIFEKIHLAAEAQKYWADNSVSVTVSFNKETESKYINTVLSMYEGQLKTVSFLPKGNETYAQMPYTEITKDEYEAYLGKLQKIDTAVLYNNGADAEGDRYCTTDVCEVPETAK